MIDRTFVALMAGGSGTRFWPLSRRARPKQVLPIAEPVPMIRATVDRLGDLVTPERILVVTGADQADALAAALPEVPRENLLLEPAARNTAPCLGFAAVVAAAREPDAVLLNLPADHVIRPAEAFRNAARAALTRADEAGALLTFGVLPTRPATGYGYIREDRETAPGIRTVAEFVEKPDRETAEGYLATGQYRWNSGMFAWRADAYLGEVATHLPDLATGLDRLQADPDAVAEVFPRLPSISVDYGIMEKTGHAEVVAADFEWDDVGSIESLARLLEPDADGNRSRTDLLALDSTDVIAVAPEGHLVAALGVAGIAVIVTEDATLVCRREDAQRVKEIVGRLGDLGREDLR
ncbi:MAG: sugar phosphate nucleotidyltransferase [Planctomycetota bacterium]